MKWYTYRVETSDREMVLCKVDDNTTISGFADSLPEYQAWLAEGNEPEEWSAE